MQTKTELKENVKHTSPHEAGAKNNYVYDKSLLP